MECDYCAVLFCLLQPSVDFPPRDAHMLLAFCTGASCAEARAATMAVLGCPTSRVSHVSVHVRLPIAALAGRTLPSSLPMAHLDLSLAPSFSDEDAAVLEAALQVPGLRCWVDSSERNDCTLVKGCLEHLVLNFLYSASHV